MDPILILAVSLAILFVFAWFVTAMQLWLMRERQNGVAGLAKLIAIALHGGGSMADKPAQAKSRTSNPLLEIVLYSCILGLLIYILPYTMTI